MQQLNLFDFIEPKAKLKPKIKRNLLGIETLENGWHWFPFVGGNLFIKIKDSKCIGMSKFEWKENCWCEVMLKPYSKLNGEPYLPPQEMLNGCLSKYFEFEELHNWFQIKTLLLSEIITNSSLRSATVTTKQVRVPNTGIVGSNKLTSYAYLKME